MKEYFTRLYLNDNATLEEVKSAYRKLAKKFHPDKNVENNDFEEEFKLIQEAYEKLNDHFAIKPLEQENKTQRFSTYSSAINNKQEKFTVDEASIDYIINGTLFCCSFCQHKFWADRTKYKSPVAFCPYCKEANFLGRVHLAFVKEAPGKQLYNCFNCNKDFYADRTIDDTVRCPHCKKICTLLNT